jgi:uncharacterized protein YjiS (DUF1127 family)
MQSGCGDTAPHRGRWALGGDAAPRRRHRMSDGAIDIRCRTGRPRAHRMRSWLRAMLGRVLGYWRRRAAEDELYRLDERMMRDIGISRADFPAILSGEYVRDESRRQRGGRSGCSPERPAPRSGPPDAAPVASPAATPSEPPSGRSPRPAMRAPRRS